MGELQSVAVSASAAIGRVDDASAVFLLVRGEGPERIVTAWWGRNTMSTRDYFKVKTDAGVWLWVFRETESGKWFVHGLWT